MMVRTVAFRFVTRGILGFLNPEGVYCNFTVSF